MPNFYKVLAILLFFCYIMFSENKVNPLPVVTATAKSRMLPDSNTEVALLRRERHTKKPALSGTVI